MPWREVGPSNRAKRDPLASALAALALCGVGAACGAGGDDPPERIVLVVVDTLRRDHLSCYGGAVETPHIDGLAQRGRVFADALASFHQTSMSMAALFTGRTPSLESGAAGATLPWSGRTWCGMARFASSLEPGGPCLPRSLPTLGEAMREAGYETLGVSSNEFLFRPAGFARGFDAWVEVGGAARSGGRGARRVSGL
jgi:arylsulfatase A-like enzyme